MSDVDQIFGSLEDIYTYFCEICSNEHIFSILYEYIGLRGFVAISATNSTVSKLVNGH
jgi:hypothetical protein